MNTPNYYNHILVVFSSHGTEKWGAELAILDYGAANRAWVNDCRPVVGDLNDLLARHEWGVRMVYFKADLVVKERLIVVCGAEEVYDYFHSHVDEVAAAGEGLERLRAAMTAAAAVDSWSYLTFLAELDDVCDGEGLFLPFAGPVVETMVDEPDSTVTITPHGVTLTLDDDGRWVSIVEESWT